LSDLVLKRYEKKRVVITGAGSGLGRAFAIEFARMGWNVGVADIDAKATKETAELVKCLGANALEIHCDVTKIDEILQTANLIKAEWGSLDILINNAGFAVGGRLNEIPLEQMERILKTNLEGTLLGCWAFIPLMKGQRSGYIVNVASSAGIACLPEMALYNITKAGIISLSETLRTELAPYNIGVSVVAPSLFKTNILNHSFFASPKNLERAIKYTNSFNLTAEKVAQVTIKSVQKNHFYIFPDWKGRWGWKAKRIFPKTYLKAITWYYKCRLRKEKIII
jgi:NAD(P)-dependent dehydrogenase (short-subunit alcohol dehydrogenase family)